jgi:hypothetical protein
MIKYAVVITTMIGLCSAMPAGAEESGVGVGVGPVGVTVGQDRGDHDRDRVRDVIRDRDHRDSDKTVIIKKGDHDRDADHDRRPDVIR